MTKGIMLKKKIDIAAARLSNCLGELRCPICSGDFSLNSHSLTCSSRHNYDISKKGYVNFFAAPSKVSRIYNANLFRARAEVSKSGIYDRLTDNISELIGKYNPEGRTVVDAGCGCGNITSPLSKAFPHSRFYGMDLSREGVDLAASLYSDPIWFVANINEMPFREGSAGIILNIMSPSNYAEFKRVLGTQGFFVKVIPGANYLAELRRFLYGENDKNEYSNSASEEHLKDSVDVVEEQRLTYKVELNNGELASLYDMTPLTANKYAETDGDNSDSLRNNFLRDFADGIEISLDFIICVCSFKDIL